MTEATTSRREFLEQTLVKMGTLATTGAFVGTGAAPGAIIGHDIGKNAMQSVEYVSENLGIHYVENQQVSSKAQVASVFGGVAGAVYGGVAGYYFWKDKKSRDNRPEASKS
ncbi:MAG: hypothetical protein KBA40_01550 [Candidatus Peribacteraceae bacterium]|nr:hypothetical protein [Candidatus Peribacteraceae bacterium]MBP9850335.1 hypothetical protein [Candidatus Peribacteraceae bacterium]